MLLILGSLVNANVNAANSGTESLLNANINAINSDDTMDSGTGSLVDVKGDSDGTGQSSHDAPMATNDSDGPADGETVLSSRQWYTSTINCQAVYRNS